MKSIGQIAALVVLLFFDTAVAKTGDEWKWPRLTEVTRCYKTTNLIARCRDYSYGETKRVLIQELEIEGIDSYGMKRDYSYGKAIQGPLCQEHLMKIQKLMSRTRQVCVTASDEYPILGKNVTYRWRSLETEHGKLIW
jgi:hypothetical protein